MKIVSLITDNLGPNDMSLLLRTARHFNTVLSARFYDTALTYTRITGETVLLWAAFIAQPRSDLHIIVAKRSTCFNSE